MEYDDMLRGAQFEGGITARDTDIHSWSELEPGQAEEFWRHLEAVTGQKFDLKHRSDTYFGCSC